MDRLPEAVLMMAAWVDEHIGGEETFLDMAREIGYSPAYCSTLFHRHTGMTLRTYQRQRRLYRAAVAIRDTPDRLIDIALDCGYSSHEALTAAFGRAYGLPPRAYRDTHALVAFPLPLSSGNTDRGGDSMLREPVTRVEYIPAHGYLGVFRRQETGSGPIWPGHDCDLVTHTVQSMGRLSHPVLPAHTAGWTIRDGERSSFYGLGVPEGYDGVVPEGFELRWVPGGYYQVYSHPPFRYPEENGEVMRRVEALAFDGEPASPGFRWKAEGHCYQRHAPEGLGYEVLRPIERK